MGIFITLLIVLLLFVCALMVLVILMQRPKQEGLGAAFGGGMTDSMFGAQTTDVLQKGTIYFAIFYFVTSALLAVLVSKKQSGSDTLGKGLEANKEAVSSEEQVEDIPAVPVPEPIPGLPGTGVTPPTGGDAPVENKVDATTIPPVEIPADPTPTTPITPLPEIPADPDPAPATSPN